MPNLSSIKNLISNSDIFGQKIKLLLNNKEKSKTFCGGFFSIILLVFLSALFLINLLDIIYKKNPVVSIEQQVSQEFASFSLDKNTFPFALVLFDSDNNLINIPNYFRFKVSLLKSGKVIGKGFGKNISEKILNLTKCKNDLFPLDLQAEYDAYNISNYLCMENSGNFDNKNLTIDGSSYLSISLSICVNESSSSGLICAPIEEILNFLKTRNLFFNIFFQNSYINTYDSSDTFNPVKYTLEKFQKSLKFNYSKNFVFSLKNEILISDTGLILPSQHEYSSTSFTPDEFSYDETEIFPGQKIKNLIEVNFLSSNRKTLYHRSFPRIQNLIANIGGLTYILKIFFSCLCFFFSTINRDEIILNKIFDFDLEIIEEEVFPAGLGYNISHIQNRMNGEKKVKSENSNINNSSNVFMFNRRREALNSVSNLPKLNKLESLHLGVGMSASPSKVTEANLKRIQIFNNNNVNTNNPLISHSVTEHKNESEINIDLQPMYQKFGNDLNPKQRSLFKFNTPIHILTHLESKQNKLNFSFCETLLYFSLSFLFKNKKNDLPQIKRKLYDKAKTSLNSLMDISNIIKKLEDFENLKLILLSFDQLALFNFISKENISLNERKLKNHGISNLKILENDKENLAKIVLNYRDKVSTNTNFEDVDRKLFNFLVEEFKQ